MNRLPRGVLQFEVLPAVGETAAVLAGDRQVGAVLGRKGRTVTDHQDEVTRHQFGARKDEVDPVGKRDEV